MISLTELRRWARVAGLGCLSAIGVFSSVPSLVHQNLALNGSLELFVAYTVTTFFLIFGFTRRFAWAYITALSAASFLFEFLQIWIPGSHPCIDGWLSSSAGAVAGAILALYVSRYLARKLV
ncbi:hypothetical protein EYW49_22085 [Siculibacillus lacustris]|uniref:VanZ family protein n=1 Tax=Siculibacillus lacustris TaxID=1549641 RepID=A0A4Q9VE38_9HYPH|nr:hypothetical protein [Siculibacillus lacustris]TBW32429.1 hypothetical protein EYW49_22085 [Siculibacillus lacustris]